MRHEFQPRALDELEEAAHWYEDRSVGLGERFHDVVQQAVALILADPGRFQKLDGRVRIFRCKVFPYKLFYTWEEARELVRIYAVAHNRRRTDYWRERLSEW